MASNANTVPLTLELLGSNSHGSDPTCGRLTTPNGLKLQVTLPRLVDLAHGTTTADLLLSGIETIANNVTVDRVEMTNLRFTPDGVQAIRMFMAIQATNVKHLQIHTVVGSDATEVDEQALTSLALAFQDSRLETLDLGSNKLGAYIWNSFSNQTQLQSLLLENVEMDDECLNVLDEHLEKKMYTGQLSKLCISNRHPTSDSGYRSGNNILYRCTNLRSLRWLNKHVKEGTSIPCHGIHQLAQKMFRLTNHLRHLELEGAQVGDEEWEELCGGLKLLHRMNHLKLRNLSITSERAKQLVLALRTGRLPLRNLDLSKNNLGDEGAEIVAQLADLRFVATNLQHLNLEYNGIGNKGGIQLFSILGAQGMEEIDIRTDGNPLDMVKVALGIAAAKYQIEHERDNLRQERDRVKSGAASVSSSDGGEQKNVRTLLAAQASMVSDMQVLQKEVEKLTQERNTLIGAFAVLGAAKHVDERNSIFQRLSRLEETVHGRRGVKYPSSKTRESFRLQAPGQEAENIAGVPRKIRPSNVKDHHAVRAPPPPLMSRDEVRARVLAEVAGLQNQKDQVRARILSDVNAIQAQRKRSPIDIAGIQARLKTKLDTQGEQRSRVLKDVARFRQEKVSRGPSDLSSVQRRDSFADSKSSEPGRRDDLGGRIVILPQGYESSDSLSTSHRRDSSAERTLKADTPKRSESGGPEILLPDSGHDSDDRKSTKRDAANRGESGVPEVILPGSTHLSKDREIPPSVSKRGQSTSDRFQRLLHRQIQNQLFKSNSRSDDVLQSGSQRHLDLTSSSHHSTASKPTRISGHSSLQSSIHGETKSKNPSLGSFIENDDSKESFRTGASSQSLPAPDMRRSSSKTSHRGNSMQVFRKMDSSRSLDKIPLHHEQSNAKEDKVDKKRFFKKAVSARYLQATENTDRPKRNKSITEDMLGGRND